MPVCEILSVESHPNLGVDEGWKQKAAKIGMAGAVSLAGAGTAALTDKVTQWMKGHAVKAPGVQSKSEDKSIGREDRLKIEPITNNPLEKRLIDYAERSGLENEELTQFLAQCAHETMDFKRMIERGGSSYFRKYEKSYAPNQARLLGNIYAGDGTRFNGRGVYTTHWQVQLRQGRPRFRSPAAGKPRARRRSRSGGENSRLVLEKARQT